jgi:tetratricopeptide (TPR) repeat protein
VTAFLIFDLDAVDENYDTDIIKTSNTSDDAHIQDETVDNIEQTDIENRSVYDDKITSEEQLLILGISHETEGRNEEAIKSYEEAVQIEDATDVNDIKSKAYQHLGNKFSETSECKEAIEFCQKAHAISPDIEAEDKVKEISHDLGERKEANACPTLGDTFQELKKHEEAIESYQKILNISEELEDKEMQIVAMQRLGTLYSMASSCYKDYNNDKAIELRTKAIEWNKRLDILGTEPSDHLFNLGGTEKAMESIHEVQNVAKNTNTGSY